MFPSLRISIENGIIRNVQKHHPVVQRMYTSEPNNIKTAVFNCCYEQNGALTRGAQNGYLLPQTVAVATPPSPSLPCFVVLTEEERKRKYQEIAKLADDLCASVGSYPQRDRDIMQMKEAQLNQKLNDAFDRIKENRKFAFLLCLDQCRELLKWVEKVDTALASYTCVDDESFIHYIKHS